MSSVSIRFSFVIAVLGVAMLPACGTSVTPTDSHVTGRAVEVIEAGAGEATVVFESGLGNDWTPWEPVPKTDVHAHHVLQLTLALRGRIDFDGVEGEAVAIAPDAPHTFEATGLVAHLFVASDGQAGRAITRALCSKRPVALIPAKLIGDFPAQLRASFEDPRATDDDLRAIGRALIARLASQSVGVEAPDPRIAKVIAWVAERLDQAVSLRDVTALVGLSPGRTRHLFVEQTGLSFRTYLLWLRLVRAVEMFAAGASLTEAAHAAGFSDSAHLSRTFRRMFGINAASLHVSQPL